MERTAISLKKVEAKILNRFLLSRSTTQLRSVGQQASRQGDIIRFLIQSTLPLGYPRQITSESLQRSQWLSEDQLEEIQLKGLKELVRWAGRNCFYYRDYPKIDSIEDLRKCPILTKKKIHDNFDALVAHDIRLIVRTTRTGGTYSPASILRDLACEAARKAGETRFRSWFGLSANPAIKTCYLWERSEVGFQPAFTRNALYLPVEGLVDRYDSVKYLKLIKKFKPDHLQGFTLALVNLAHNELQEHINPDIGVISCNCEPLLPIHRKLLEDAFRCQVFNFYGSQDLGSMAQDCSKHKGLHLNSERYILEVTEDGRFLFTDLLSYGMPIIRYENQDMGELVGKGCSCSRGLPLIKEVIGRVLSFVLTKKGTWVGIATLKTNMYKVKGFYELVDKYQLVQDEPGRVYLLIKPWEKGKVPDLEALARIWSKGELDIEVKVVDSIIASKSGKHLALVSKFSPPWLGKF